MRKLQLIIALACMGWTVKAQDSLKTVQLDEVVITGTKTEIPVEKSGKSIFKITRKDIEESGSRSVTDILNNVPGLQMDGNFGPLGTNISYFIRGASSKSTLILVDGIPFNDPSGIDQTYDLRLIDLSQVESIEILKGGLSTLYGTGAAAGVINITLKQASKNGIDGSVGLEYGSFNTVRHNLNLTEKIGSVSYLFNLGYKRSDGFSAALDESGSGNFDNDGFEGFNTLAKIGYELSDDISLSFTGALDDFGYDFDVAEFTDSPDNTADYQQWRYGLSSKIKVGQTKIKTDLFFSKLNRFFNTPAGFSPTTEYDADNIQAEILVDQNLKDNLKLIGGVNFQKLAYSQQDVEETDFSLIDPYASLIYAQSDFNVQVGGRLNQHSEYGSNFVYNINPSYLLSFNSLDLKIFSSYSTSFITPSLFQLFGPFGANQGLQPEESESIEGGVSFFGDTFKFEAVYYRRRDENLIVFGVNGYENAGGEINTDGIELNGEFTWSEQVSLTGNYTYVRLLDESVLFRIPEHKYGVSVNYKPIRALSLKTSYLHTGDRNQPFFNPSTFATEIIETASFDLVDFFAAYQLKRLTISVAVNNIFDEDFIAQYGFTAIGRNYNAGLRYSFN
ncbi:TonB-dependent receptor plug domain-containing protein [Ekhidna sp. To15]|uniref:TonB-dependent receptor plug domain-containing protein n=1 Tax=Ekhidna sp. To15 TaxID=3395267 RepID=UPI003F528C82